MPRLEALSQAHWHQGAWAAEKLPSAGHRMQSEVELDIAIPSALPCGHLVLADGEDTYGMDRRKLKEAGVDASWFSIEGSSVAQRTVGNVWKWSGHQDSRWGLLRATVCPRQHLEPRLPGPMRRSRQWEKRTLNEEHERPLCGSLHLGVTLWPAHWPGMLTGYRWTRHLGSLHHRNSWRGRGHFTGRCNKAQHGGPPPEQVAELQSKSQAVDTGLRTTLP